MSDEILDPKNDPMEVGHVTFFKDEVMISGAAIEYGVDLEELIRHAKLSTACRFGKAIIEQVGMEEKYRPVEILGHLMKRSYVLEVVVFKKENYKKFKRGIREALIAHSATTELMIEMGRLLKELEAGR